MSLHYRRVELALWQLPVLVCEANKASTVEAKILVNFFAGTLSY
jgi:hypothetical protein